MKKIEKSIELGGKKLTLSTGDLAQQAGGAVLATYGETVVLATVTASPLANDLGYFPLTVEYQEKLYAGGRIKGSRWIKREGRPTDEEILTGRLIDRSIRPLFPKEYKGKDVQVVLTVLSVDLENSPEIVAGIAASAAVSVSPIPWNGPVGMIRVGLVEGKFVTNPTEKELLSSEIDLVVSATKDSIVMIEAGANEVEESRITEAVSHGQKEAAKAINLVNDLAESVKTKKEPVEKEKVDSGLYKKIKEATSKKFKELASAMATKESGYSEFEEVKAAVLAGLADEDRAKGLVYFEDLFKKEIRETILSGKRPDGRKTDELRDLSAKVSILPRTHGSALFQRGQTQALSIATLGASSLEQLIETASGEESKRYIHHYSMPPYSTGETGRMGSPSRREIGHGALAERALLPVIPSEDNFPYTIRVVTEILSSNGSTSMASTCGSTLSLMDAGVPIKAPIAGIAMGVIIDDSYESGKSAVKEKYSILTDIVGLEDGFGDMDFKVAGSKDGITALQLDVKTLKLNLLILEKALLQAKKARLEILKVMLKAIDKPKSQVSKYAPKIKIIRINPEKIGELIGPGGKTIKRISAEEGVQIDVDDLGTVHVSAPTEDNLEKAIIRVESITKDPVSGEIYEGTVKRVQTFGAFVEILPGREGLVHVSDMSEDFVKDPSSLVKVGDKIQVRVRGIDEMGRLNLSMMLDPKFDALKEERRREKRNDQRNDYGYKKFDKRGQFERKNRGGPHFPRSRFIENKKNRFS